MERLRQRDGSGELRSGLEPLLSQNDIEEPKESRLIRGLRTIKYELSRVKYSLPIMATTISSDRILTYYALTANIGLSEANPFQLGFNYVFGLVPGMVISGIFWPSYFYWSGKRDEKANPIKYKNRVNETFKVLAGLEYYVSLSNYIQLKEYGFHSTLTNIPNQEFIPLSIVLAAIPMIYVFRKAIKRMFSKGEDTHAIPIQGYQ